MKMGKYNTTCKYENGWDLFTNPGLLFVLEHNRST